MNLGTTQNSFFNKTQPSTSMFSQNKPNLTFNSNSGNNFNMNSQKQTTSMFNQQPSMTNAPFQNRFGMNSGMSMGMNMGMGNVSDSELKSVIDTYSSLYNPNNSENLIKWPVFNPRNLGNQKILFNGQINNIQELEYLWTISEQKINPDPSRLTSCLLIGLENLEERSKQNNMVCEEMIKQLDDNIAKKSADICHNVENQIMAKISKIKDKNSLILNRIIKMEHKLYLFSRKIKNEHSQLEEKYKLKNILKTLKDQMLILDQQVQEISFMINSKLNKK